MILLSPLGRRSHHSGRVRFWYGFYSNNTWEHSSDFTDTADNSGGGSYHVDSVGGPIDCYFIYGPTFREILKKYSELTGRSWLVPNWAFGLEYRARYLENQESLLKIAKTFREKGIPCDIIALEPGWEAVPYATDGRWSPTRFPDPVGMIRQLNEMGFQLDLWESGKAPYRNFRSRLVPYLSGEDSGRSGRVYLPAGKWNDWTEDEGRGLSDPDPRRTRSCATGIQVRRSVGRGNHAAHVSAILLDSGSRRISSPSSPVCFYIKRSGDRALDSVVGEVAVHDGQAGSDVFSGKTPGMAEVWAEFERLRSEPVRIESVTGRLAVRINPPEAIELPSGGDWLPKRVTVFVSIRVRGWLTRTATPKVTLTIQDADHRVLKSFHEEATHGELEFKDVTYGTRPEKYHFVVSSPGFEPVTLRVFPSTWGK